MSASSRTISGALPPSSSSAGLRYFAAVWAMMRPTRVEPVKLTTSHSGMRNQCLNERRRVFRGVGDDIDDAGRQSRIAQTFRDQTVRARADSEAFRTTVLPQAERQRHGAHAEDHRRVPGRDAEHDAGRLPDRHREATWLVGRNDFAGNLRGHCGGFPQHARCKADVKSGPAGRAPVSVAISSTNCAAPGLEFVGGLQ